MPEKKFKVSLKPIGVEIRKAERELKNIQRKIDKKRQRKITLHIQVLNRTLKYVKALCKRFTSTYPA